MRRSRVRTVVGLSGGLALTLFGTAWAYARATEPLVPLSRDADRENEAALRELVRQIGDPRDFEEGQVLTIRLDQEQVSALAAEASRRRRRLSARAELREGGVEVLVSAASPSAWLTPYVNLRASVSGSPSAPVVEGATLGSLPLPAALGQMLFDFAYAQAQDREPLLGAAAAAVQEIVYGADELTVQVAWTEAVRQRIRTAGRATVTDELGGDGLYVYTDVLRRTLEEPGSRRWRNLVEILPPVFTAVRTRVAEGEDARRELEAAMVVLSIYSVGHPLSHVLGDEAPLPPQYSLRLQGRSDLSKHLLVSAVTTLFAERTFADALGLGKELRDADDADGSGFSFRDLAADRTGARLMSEAVRSSARLDALIDVLAEPLDERDLLPEVGDLPEGMDAAAFRAAYDDVDSEAYLALIARIDARTDACAVMRAVTRSD
jgi:hypothetical protein